MRDAAGVTRVSYDAVHAFRDECVGGADAQFKRKVLPEGVEAVRAEEGACEAEEGASEQGGGDCGEGGGGGGVEGAEDRVDEGGWTVAAQREEDRAFEERPERYQGLRRWVSVWYIIDDSESAL